MSGAGWPVGLLAQKGSYAVDALLGWGGLPCAHVVLHDGDANPYGLAEVDKGTTVLVASNWLWEQAAHGLDPLRDVLRPLRKRFDRIIALDHADPAQLDFPELVVREVDGVLKVNAIYRDRELYNWVVGAPTPDGTWVAHREPRKERYSSQSLDKVHLGLPCFVGTDPWFRRRARPFYGLSGASRVVRAAGDQLGGAIAGVPLIPRDGVHFLAALTHVQRLHAARILKASGVRWRGGLMHVPSLVTGLHGNGLARMSTTERSRMEALLKEEGLATAPHPRLLYLAAMLRCRAVLSITGYGEICFRMGEAWAMGRLLVCQDLGHVETLFPLDPGRNVVYCRPDLSDLRDLIQEIDRASATSDKIAQCGQDQWRSWIGDPDRIMRQAFAPLLP